MNLPEKTKVKLYIHAVKNYDWEENPNDYGIHVSILDCSESDHYTTPHILIGTTEVEIDVPSVTSQELTLYRVNTLQEALQKHNAESEVKRQNIQSQIDDLLSLEHKGE